jgi:hypothetical protein
VCGRLPFFVLGKGLVVVLFGDLKNQLFIYVEFFMGVLKVAFQNCSDLWQAPKCFFTTLYIKSVISDK